MSKWSIATANIAILILSKHLGPKTWWYCRGSLSRMPSSDPKCQEDAPTKRLCYITKCLSPECITKFHALHCMAIYPYEAYNVHTTLSTTLKIPLHFVWSFFIVDVPTCLPPPLLASSLPPPHPCWRWITKPTNQKPGHKIKWFQMEWGVWRS